MPTRPGSSASSPPDRDIERHRTTPRDGRATLQSGRMRTTKFPAILAFIALASCTTTSKDSPAISPALTPRTAGMVDVATLVPELRVDMRYATTNNFMGAHVMGYDAPRCYLLRPAAESLARVQTALDESHQRLQVFDCYRPVRAVQHFVRSEARR